MIDSPYAGMVAVCCVVPMILVPLMVYWARHDGGDDEA